MDAHRSGDTVTESAIDRELQAMLDVDPSPEFVARVRARVADEPQRSTWWLSWKLATAVAISAVVVLAIVGSRSRERSTGTATVVARSGAPAVPQGPSRVEDIAPPLARESGEPRRSAPTRVTRVTREAPNVVRAIRPAQAAGKPSPPGEPEILIDARESSALRALILGARDGRVDLEPVLHASTPSVMDLPPVAAIDIPLIVIDPIAPGTGEEGVRQ
jgi:hypothetical protein